MSNLIYNLFSIIKKFEEEITRPNYTHSEGYCIDDDGSVIKIKDYKKKQKKNKNKIINYV